VVHSHHLPCRDAILLGVCSELVRGLSQICNWRVLGRKGTVWTRLRPCRYRGCGGGQPVHELADQ